MNGGALIAEVLRRHGVEHLFTLCGGHISPILVESKARGIRVVDVRHEATAVFAADAVGRLSDVPGVAAVTAGPGLTNTITALKNAQIAESPLVLIGGGAPTLLKGRGALQDIDQMALIKPHVKRSFAATRVRHLVPMLESAFQIARDGVPGPVFVECPVDLLYEESLIRSWYTGKTTGKSLAAKLVSTYLAWHGKRLFAGADRRSPGAPKPFGVPEPTDGDVRRAIRLVNRAQRPILIVGSGALQTPGRVRDLVAAVEDLGVPTYLAGMARGLLGVDHRLQLRHGRTAALRRSDLVILAGFPADFRLDYGRKVPRSAKIISINRCEETVRKNRKPNVAAVADPGLFLARMTRAGSGIDGDRFGEWLVDLRDADGERDAEIARQAAQPAPPINPVALCREIEAALPDEAILVADGGDFVATASYVVKPRGPLSWLDPGAFGTLGVGAGFALGAKLCRPESEVWLLYGDGSAGYSLAEVDTFVRHGIPIIAIIGNDASWAQIAREQVEILGDDVGTELARTDYHSAAVGFGGAGLKLDHVEDVADVLRAARAASRDGRVVVINAHLGATDFRKGSISM